MSFDPSFDIGIVETRRRRKRSAIPSFTGDIDLQKLARGVQFHSSADFGKRATQQNLLGQRGRVASTPLRLQAEGDLTDAFLTNPLASPTIDPSRKSNGKRKKSKRDKGRSSLVKERTRLGRGKAPRNSRQADFSLNDTSFRGLGI